MPYLRIPNPHIFFLLPTPLLELVRDEINISLDLMPSPKLFKYYYIDTLSRVIGTNDYEESCLQGKKFRLVSDKAIVDEHGVRKYHVRVGFDSKDGIVYDNLGRPKVWFADVLGVLATPADISILSGPIDNTFEVTKSRFATLTEALNKFEEYESRFEATPLKPRRLHSKPLTTGFNETYKSMDANVKTPNLLNAQETHSKYGSKFPVPDIKLITSIFDALFTNSHEAVYELPVRVTAGGESFWISVTNKINDQYFGYVNNHLYLTSEHDIKYMDLVQFSLFNVIEIL